MTSSRLLVLGWVVATAFNAGCDAGDGGQGSDASIQDGAASLDTQGAGDGAATVDTVALGDAGEDSRVGTDTATIVDGEPARDTVTDTLIAADSSPADGDQDGVVDSTQADAQGDTSAADPWAGLSDQALREALQTWTSASHTPLGYNGARDAMYAVGGIDDHGGRVEAIYTGRTVDTDGSRTPSKHCELADGTPTSCGLNTEHTWPKYYLRLYLSDGSAEYRAAEGDIHHIFPADSEVNTARWHFDFGETPCQTTHDCAIDEGSILGLRPGSDGSPSCPRGNLALDKDCVMWVRPERRGDVARAQLYMAVRYDMPIPEDVEAWLRAWNLSDPPDQRERDRNDAIEAAQGNRNPFVDWPELAARISDF